MLVVLILLVIVFAAGRLGLRRYGMASAVATYVAAGFVLAYAGGLLSARLFLVQNQPAEISASSDAPVPRGSAAISKQTLDEAALVALKPADTAAPGAIDALGIAPGTNTLTVYGWVADPESKAAARSAVFVIDGKKRIDATPWYGGDRPDVAKVYGSPAMEFTGFANASISVAGLPPGRHSLQVGAVSTSGDRLFVTSAKQVKYFIVKP